MVLMDGATGAVIRRDGVQMVQTDPMAAGLPYRTFPQQLVRAGRAAGRLARAAGRVVNGLNNNAQGAAVAA